MLITKLRIFSIDDLIRWYLLGVAAALVVVCGLVITSGKDTLSQEEMGDYTEKILGWPLFVFTVGLAVCLWLSIQIGTAIKKKD